MSHNDIPLPFATLDISAGFSSIVVCNLLPTTLKALCGEALGRVQPLGDMHHLLRPTQNSLNFAHFLLMPRHQLTYSFFSLLMTFPNFEQPSQLLHLLAQFRSFDAVQPAFSGSHIDCQSPRRY